MMVQQQQQAQGATPTTPMTKTSAAVVGTKRTTTTTTTTSAVRCLMSSSVTLLLLVLLSWAPQLASGASSSSSSSSSLGLCIGKAQACSMDEVCKDCLGSWNVKNVDDTCVTDIAEVQSASSGDCGTAGIETCCGFEAGTSDTCMANALMVEYWACIQSGNGCDLDDLPCYGFDEDSTADAVTEDEIQAASSGATAGKMSSSGLLLGLASASAAAAAVASALA